MKKKTFAVVAVCVSLLFFGALISRDLHKNFFGANMRTINLNSESPVQNLENSCESLCRDAYCEGSEADEGCIEEYTLCTDGCVKVESSFR